MLYIILCVIGISVVGYMIGKIRIGFDDARLQIDAKKMGKTEYYDHYGRRRSTTTNELLYHSVRNNELFLTDSKGNVIKNLSDEKAWANVNGQIDDIDNKGKTLFRFAPKKIIDPRYGGIKTVQLYYDKIGTVTSAVVL